MMEKGWDVLLGLHEPLFNSVRMLRFRRPPSPVACFLIMKHGGIRSMHIRNSKGIIYRLMLYMVIYGHCSAFCTDNNFSLLLLVCVVWVTLRNGTYLTPCQV